MLKYKAIVVTALVVAVGAFEIQQVVAACRCVCEAVTGLPASVDVTDATGGCDTLFSYTYKVHFATNDDNCGEGIGGNAVAYPSSSYSENLVDSGSTKHKITPASFTISGAGTTKQFTVTGQLDTPCLDGISATQVLDSNTDCDTGVLFGAHRHSAPRAQLTGCAWMECSAPHEMPVARGSHRGDRQRRCH